MNRRASSELGSWRIEVHLVPPGFPWFREGGDVTVADTVYDPSSPSTIIRGTRRPTRKLRNRCFMSLCISRSRPGNRQLNSSKRSRRATKLPILCSVPEIRNEQWVKCYCRPASTGSCRWCRVNLVCATVADPPGLKQTRAYQEDLEGLVHKTLRNGLPKQLQRRGTSRRLLVRSQRRSVPSGTGGADCSRAVAKCHLLLSVIFLGYGCAENQSGKL